MRRRVLILLLVALVGGAVVAPAEAAKKKKKKPPAPVPVAVDVVYNLVAGGDAGCALSIATGEPAACGDPYGGAVTGPVAGTGPIAIPAADGLPLTFDAAKPIKGKFVMRSYGLAAVPQAPLGTGEAEVHFLLTATSGGEELTLGEATTDAYLVSPASRTYAVEFEMTPPGEAAGKVLDTLTLTYEMTGPAVLHGAMGDDGNTLTLGAFAAPQ